MYYSRGMGRVTTFGVPIDCVGEPVGTVFSPRVLREAGVIGSLAADDLGDLEVHLGPAERDPGTGIVGSDSVLETTTTLRRAAAEHADPAGSLVVLGGCCTMAAGVVAGLRDRFGDVGLVYVDGHLDLYDGENSPGGEAADMPLAVLLGVGPPAWNAAAGAPVLDPSAVALLGFRDLDEARGFGSVTPEELPGMTALDADAVRRSGPAAAAVVARSAAGAGGRPYWVNLDVDVLDPAVLPVDAPVPGGLGWDELSDLLAPLVGDPACLGISVGCYNPDLDPTREHAARVARLVRDVVPPAS